MTENLQRIGFLACVPGLLQEFGADPDEVLAAVGLVPEALNNPENTVSYPTMGRLLEACVAHTGCSHFGLLVGDRAGALSLGLIGALMAHAPTLGVAMRDLVLHQHRHARGAVVYLLDQQDAVLFGYAIYQSDIAGAAQIYDGAVAMACSIIRRAIGRDHADELTVLLSRSEPPDVHAYRRCLGSKVQFDSEFSGVLLPRALMTANVAGADPVERKSLEARVAGYWQVGDYDIVTRLRRALASGLLTGQIGGDEMADALGMPRRTMTRRLADCDTTFQAVLDETRFELARQLLGNTGLPISQISLVLRYADQSVLTRAFARWSGIPPREWRGRSRGWPAEVA